MSLISGKASYRANCSPVEQMSSIVVVLEASGFDIVSGSHRPPVQT